ncbi:MAG: PqqD family protein [bacterium]|nr:MAG: PqqD family protein [bacterium]
MKGKNDPTRRRHPSEKNGSKSDEKGSDLSRRKFIKIGAATVAISVVSGGLLKFLLPRQKKSRSINASTERPNKNPAFSFRKKRDDSLICVTRLPDGKVLRHELNSVAAELYLACDGQRNREEIIRQAATKLGKEVERFTPEARQFLVELEKQNLIVTTGKVNLFYTTVVRYEQA